MWSNCFITIRSCSLKNAFIFWGQFCTAELTSRVLYQPQIIINYSYVRFSHVSRAPFPRSSFFCANMGYSAPGAYFATIFFRLFGWMFTVGNCDLGKKQFPTVYIRPDTQSPWWVWPGCATSVEIVLDRRKKARSASLNLFFVKITNSNWQTKLW